MNIFESLYYLGLKLKTSYLTDEQKRLPFKVLSIGNITVGGTGKTPVTIALAEEAKTKGFQPVILTRGYKGKIKGPVFVTKNNIILLDVEEAGDEPILMAERLIDVPIVKGIDRYEAGMYAINVLRTKKRKQIMQPPPRKLTFPDIIFILDDGFQHRALHRDKDILLIDAEDPFGNRKLLPSGRLREPLSAIGRADIILLTKCSTDRKRLDEKTKELLDEIKQYNAKAPVFFSEHLPIWVRFRSGDRKIFEWLANKKVFGFCALGSPTSFFNTIKSSGATITGFQRYRDHYKYRPRDIGNIVQKARETDADWIVTTEKDYVKIRHLDLPENILIIEIELFVERAFFHEVFRF